MNHFAKLSKYIQEYKDETTHKPQLSTNRALFIQNIPKKKFLKLSIWEIEKKWLNVFGQMKIIKTYVYFPY